MTHIEKGYTPEECDKILENIETQRQQVFGEQE